MSFRDRFCFSRKGGIGGGGWVHPKGANSMAVSGLVSRIDLVGTGRANSVLFGINGVRNKRSHLVEPHFQRSRPFFQLQQVGVSRQTYLGICYLVGMVRVTYLLRMAEITSWSSSEPNNPTEQKLGYV